MLGYTVAIALTSLLLLPTPACGHGYEVEIHIQDNSTLCDLGDACFNNTPCNISDACFSNTSCNMSDACFSCTPCNISDACFSYTSCNMSDACFSCTPCNISDACFSYTFCNMSDACFSCAPCNISDACSSNTSCKSCFSNTSCNVCFSNTSCYIRDACFSNTSCNSSDPCSSNASCNICFSNTSCYISDACFSNTSCNISDACFSNTSCYIHDACFSNTSCYIHDPCSSNASCNICFSNTSCYISDACFSNTSCNVCFSNTSCDACFSNASCYISDACFRSTTQNVMCNSLDDALEWMQHSPKSVAIYLEADRHYTLELGHNITNGEHLAIFGDNSTISCLPLAGIGFRNTTDIKLSRVSLLECGANRLSTSRDFHHQDFKFLVYRVALYFIQSDAIVLEWVTIKDSDGTGLVFLHCTGRNRISHSLFSGNVPSDNGSFGGGVIIEFVPETVTCVEGFHHCSPSLHDHMNRAHFDFNSCNFTKNNASSGGIMDNHIPRNEPGRMLLGKGGALALYFRDSANDNTVSVSNCNFSYNAAQSGGGMYVDLEHSSNNSIEIKDSSNFEYNRCYYNESQTEAGCGSGGGMHVIFTDHSSGNTIAVSHTNFTGNVAYYGGALEVFAGTFYWETNDLGSVSVAECSFKRNTARLGAAIELYHKPSSAKGYRSQLHDCTFLNNGGTQIYPNRTVRMTTIGTLSISYGHANFLGNTQFTGSHGTALSLQNTVVDFEDNAIVNFTNCSGGNGGAINLQGGASVIFLHNNTELYFYNNTATKKGGAIYADQSHEHYTGYSYDCFFRYDDSRVLPFEWNTTVIFSGNKASDSLSNSIFAESLLPCVWARKVDSRLQDDLADTICKWKNWTFEDSDCSQEIETAALSLAVNSADIQLYPGKPHKLNLTINDDLGQDVRKQTALIATVEERTEYIYNGEITLPTAPNTSVKIVLESLNTRTAYIEFNATILNCPPGFVLKQVNGNHECICGKGFVGNIDCNASANGASILVGYCMSYTAVSGHQRQQLVGRCPFSLEKQKTGVYFPLRTLTPEKLESQFCGQFKRTSFLCGKCTHGYGVSVFSKTFRCIKCTHSSLERAWNWLLYFAVTLGPITVFFAIVVLLHVSITSGPANGFVFFSQMLTIPLKVLLIQGGWILALQNKRLAKLFTDILVTPYSIWSFDFTDVYDFSRCLGPKLKIIDVLMLRYVSALYPLVLVIISFVLLELYARNNRLLVCLSQPFCMCCARLRRKWQGKTSIIDAFATFLILSYVKVIRISITVLTPSKVYNDAGDTVTYTVNYDNEVLYLKSMHAPYFALALFTMGTLGTFVPLLLMLYPTALFQRCLNRCRIRSEGLRAFVEAFHGCYKDGRNGTPDRRFFAGLYFVFRIVIFTIVMLSTTYIAMFLLLEIAYTAFLFLMVLLQPYKKPFYNYLDAFFFALMGTIMALVAYMYTSLPTRHHLPYRVFYLTYSISFVPLLYMIGYMIYWVSYKSKWARRKVSAIYMYCRGATKLNHEEEEIIEREPTSVSTNQEEEDPDRLANPQDYEDNTSDEDTYVIPQFASENVRLVRERQPQYGTMVINAVTY